MQSAHQNQAKTGGASGLIAASVGSGEKFSFASLRKAITTKTEAMKAKVDEFRDQIPWTPPASFASVALVASSNTPVADLIAKLGAGGPADMSRQRSAGDPSGLSVPPASGEDLDAAKNVLANLSWSKPEPR